VRVVRAPGGSAVRALHRAPARDDAGFTIVEIVVAMVVFSVLLAASLPVLLSGTAATREAVQRTAAAELLTRQIEAARGTDALAIPDGRVVTTQVVGGTTYTIMQDANYVSTGATDSVCESSSNSLAYKLVTVRVTWPGMAASIKPVRADTLRAVGVGSDGLDATRGTLALSVVGASGAPTEDVPVTLMPGNLTRTTGSDGCAVFASLAPGTYTATASIPGYSGSLNTQTASVSGLGVVAAGVRRGVLLYDTVRSVDVRTDAPAGAVVPPGLALRAGDTYTPEGTLPTCGGTSGAAACAVATPGLVRGLFPETWTFKVGTCSEAAPSQVVADLRPAVLALSPPTVTIPVGAVRVDVRTPAGAQAGRTVTATHGAGPGCPAGETWTLPSTASGGSFLVLPYGSWIFTSSNVAVPMTVTVGPSNRTPTVTLAAAA
jgi:prepilin-type N-terminal cleavage/methylation domain-containing protein